MSSDSFNLYLPIFLLGGLALFVFVLGLLVARLLSPHKPYKGKELPYECGEQPEGLAWSFFNIRFYIVGLIFLIFDVESVLMFPVAILFKKMVNQGEGPYILLIFLSFIFVLLEGLAYCWKKGDLDWPKTSSHTSGIDKKLES